MNLHPVIRYLALFVTCMILPLLANRALAAGTDDARQFVDNVGKQVVEVVNGSSGESEKQAKLRQLFITNVDIDWMAKFVLGQGWQKATADQRTRYQQVYRDYLLARYTTNFADYTGSKYALTDATNEEAGQFTVHMKIKAPNKGQENLLAGYRVKQENGAFKITDIIVEGVSLITTERSEFSSVLQQKGMDGLITAIEEKTKAAAAQ